MEKTLRPEGVTIRQSRYWPTDRLGESHVYDVWVREPDAEHSWGFVVTYTESYGASHGQYHEGAPCARYLEDTRELPWADLPEGLREFVAGIVRGKREEWEQGR
jgi:hypothetical protein